MNTGCQTTYILLDRGVEDKGIYREIEKIAYQHYGGITKKFAKEHPLLLKLYHGLRDEISSHDDM